MKVNLTRSRALGRIIDAQPKACWWNAYYGLKYLHHWRGDSVSTYVEGWALHRFPLPVEHAWLEVRGSIIETTPAWLENHASSRYFPGRRYTWPELERLAKDHPHEDGSGDPDLPLVWRTGGWGGFQLPDYKAAYDAAHVAAYGCTQEELMAKLTNNAITLNEGAQ